MKGRQIATVLVQMLATVAFFIDVRCEIEFILVSGLLTALQSTRTVQLQDLSCMELVCDVHCITLAGCYTDAAVNSSDLFEARLVTSLANS